MIVVLRDPNDGLWMYDGFKFHVSLLYHPYGCSYLIYVPDKAPVQDLSTTRY